MTKFTLMKHFQNQHGFSVSLAKYVDGKLVEGFVLATLETGPQQEQYIKDLCEMTGFEQEDM